MRPEREPGATHLQGHGGLRSFFRMCRDHWRIKENGHLEKIKARYANWGCVTLHRRDEWRVGQCSSSRGDKISQTAKSGRNTGQSSRAGP